MANTEERHFSISFITGVVALVFLILGYQTALFIHNTSVTKIVANRDDPDTVFIYIQQKDSSKTAVRTEYKPSVHLPEVKQIRKSIPRRHIENFVFNPNTVSVDDLQRLGFTFKQAEAIDNYRRKGGYFNRKQDFSKSFVVADSVYTRLERFIVIPQVDINLADSVEFDNLPGIGGWFASRIIAYRKRLGGFSYKEQLLDIYRFDKEKYDGLSDLIKVDSSNVTPYPLWSLPADSLSSHPYVGNFETARAIVLFRENNPVGNWTIESLCSAGILSRENADKLSRCAILSP